MREFGKGVLLGAALCLLLVGGFEAGSHLRGASGAPPSPPPTPVRVHAGARRMLPAVRASRALSLPALGVLEAPPPAGATPRISSARALTRAGARHDTGLVTAQPVLVAFTDQSLRLRGLLAWDVRETGCFPIPTPAPSPGRPASASPVPCDTHRDVIVNAKTGARIEVLDF